jgi:hypothetical protein
MLRIGLGIGLTTTMSGAANIFRLTCTTTGAETLTLQALGIATGETVIVTWGDGNSDAYSGDATRTHAYAGAGTWTVTFYTPHHIVKLDLRDTKISGTINAANPMPTSLTSLHLESLANVTVGVGEIGGLTSLIYLRLISLVNVTVGAGEIGGLTSLTYLYLYDLANVTVGAGEIGGLTSLTYLYLVYVAGVAVQTAYPAIIRTIQYENNLSQANELAIMTGIHASRMSFTYTAITLDIAGGGNASPDGTYADEDPPVTTRGFIYEMVNDPELENFKKWAITYTP